MQRGSRIKARWVPPCLFASFFVFFCQELVRNFLACRGVGLTADSPTRERDLGCFAFQRNPPKTQPLPQGAGSEPERAGAFESLGGEG